MQISVVYSFLVLKVELSLIMSCGPLFKASLFFLANEMESENRVNDQQVLAFGGCGELGILLKFHGFTDWFSTCYWKNNDSFCQIDFLLPSNLIVEF